MKVLILNGSPRNESNTQIALAREQYGLPEREPGQMTSFVR